MDDKQHKRYEHEEQSAAQGNTCPGYPAQTKHHKRFYYAVVADLIRHWPSPCIVSGYAMGSKLFSQLCMHRGGGDCRDVCTHPSDLFRSSPVTTLQSCALQLELKVYTSTYRRKTHLTRTSPSSIHARNALRYTVSDSRKG